MNVSPLLAAGLLIATAAAAGAQGYAGLGTDAEGYAPVEPGKTFAFPRDHAPHPEFRIEWWYVTANLESPQGRSYGVQWTLFRNALTPEGSGDDRGGQDNWTSQLWMGHAGLTTAETHFSAELFARGGIGQAGVELDPFSAWIDDWSMTAIDPAGDALSDLRVEASTDRFSYELELTTEADPVLQGDGGYSVKSPAGQASYYYSQPFYEAAGTLTIDGESVPVSGRAWLDREWSSQPLGEDQEGWDWFSLHMPDGAKLMLYQIRSATGDVYVPATWITPDGKPQAIDPDEAELTPLQWTEVSGRTVPTRWRMRIPSRGIDIETMPLNPESWMDTAFSYWEGPIRFEGSHAGVGYLEMTGYGDD